MEAAYCLCVDDVIVLIIKVIYYSKIKTEIILKQEDYSNTPVFFM